MKGKIVRVLKLLFTPVAFAFLLYFAWRSRSDLASLIRNASLLYIALAAIVWGMLHALSPLIAVVLLNACGANVSWRQAFATHAARLPARYLPGGIWHTVGRGMDYRAQGVDARQLSAFVFLENALAASITLAVGGAIVFATRGDNTLGTIAGLAGLAGAIGLPVLLVVINTRVLGGENRLATAAYLQSIVLVLVFWAGAAVAFLLYLNAFPESTGPYSSIEMAGIYLFSWGVGFLAIFAPQGIGVFELVASELMASPIGFMGLAALIAGFRVVVLFADIAVWLIFQVMSRRA
ncbi:MAG TPA: hypothetical protein PKH39_05155 [Woeseiaceae bacterium]|nr:hypothetical protein [Woeseiaceae bacterium]